MARFFPLVLLLCAATGMAEERVSALFLVAKRGMSDPHFRETVVLVTQHGGGGGTLGVIINRPTAVPLSQLFPSNEVLKTAPDKVFSGGPVQPGSLVFVFRNVPGIRQSEALQVMKGVYMSSHGPLLADLFKRPEPTRDLRVFAGYAGWAPGQLQAEIARGDWHVIEADAASLFEKDPARLWPEMQGRASARSVHLENKGHAAL